MWWWWGVKIKMDDVMLTGKEYPKKRINFRITLCFHYTLL